MEAVKFDKWSTNEGAFLDLAVIARFVWFYSTRVRIVVYIPEKVVEYKELCTSPGFGTVVPRSAIQGSWGSLEISERLAMPSGVPMGPISYFGTTSSGRDLQAHWCRPFSICSLDRFSDNTYI